MFITEKDSSVADHVYVVTEGHDRNTVHVSVPR